MAFRSENQKIVLNLREVEELLGLPEGIEVTGFQSHRDPAFLEIFLFNPHLPDEQSSVRYDSELPIIPHKVDL